MVSSADGARWVAVDGDTVTGDASSEALMARHAGEPVEAAAMGYRYTPTGPGDAVGLYLLARQLVGSPATVTGHPPRVPARPGSPPSPVVH